MRRSNPRRRLIQLAGEGLAVAAILFLAAIELASCQGTYSWGPSGRSINVGIDPALIAPALDVIDDHWRPPFER